MKKDDTSLGVLPVKNDDSSEKLEQLKHLREMMEMMNATWNEQVEIMEMRAKLDKAHFDALVKAGFSKEDALDIIKAKGV